MEEFYASIANLGFPIAISVYLLVRIEGKLNVLTDSINELTKAIITLRWKIPSLALRVPRLKLSKEDL